MDQPTRNLTWVIGDYRIYVALEVSGDPEIWQWNVRDSRWGWEVRGTITGSREDAMIAAFEAAQTIGFGMYKQGFDVIVNGQKVFLAVAPQTPITDFKALAIKAAGYTQDGTVWDIRDSQGAAIDPTWPVQIFSGQCWLTIHPRAGVQA
jgi:hypothetical protein